MISAEVATHNTPSSSRRGRSILRALTGAGAESPWLRAVQGSAEVLPGSCASGSAAWQTAAKAAIMSAQEGRMRLLDMAKARTFLRATSRIVPIARLRAIALGGLMNEQEREQPLGGSSVRDIHSTLRITDPASSIPHHGNSSSMRDNEYEIHLSDLQQYICELLIKNQQLRLTLEAATNHQCGDVADDHN